MPLLFSFDRTFETFKETFPDLFKVFIKGDFTVKQNKRKFGVILVDQALEKEYNKNAKGKGGIIGFTREKEAVAKWNIIKHEKMQCFKFLNDLCNLSSDSKYSIHHEYSPSGTAEDWVHVTEIYLYIKERMNLFSSTKIMTSLTSPRGFSLMPEKKRFCLNVFPMEMKHTTTL